MSKLSARYKAVQVGTNGRWAIYDHKRGVKLLSSMSPKAVYNESVVNEIVELLNDAEAYHAAAMAEIRKEVKALPTYNGMIDREQLLAILDKHIPKP